MADEKVTPIRPDVKPIKRKRDRGESLTAQIYGFQSRLARAVALSRAMAVAFQDQSAETGTPREIDAMDGMLGLADLIEHIQEDMVNLTG